MTKQKPQNIDEYVSQFPLETQRTLNALLTCLSEVVPEAEKGLKWGVPAFTYRRVLFTVGAFKNHINFYPTPATINTFNKELKPFSTTKSAIQLQLNQPLPFKLIREIARHRFKDVVENDAKWM
ncbi:iron chaperone [Lentibacillus amyloliquefaciens]|uniref:YdhG-like domain-containing protein n=1 Tax=Lentibacillus amyloliquefaciens TaxID=1472767 RepID=A0A0U4F663_9BACI|nr:DUF1801 domain-containing protein [Lentibacillus amyloliquefaciens]ALX48275.1 hypothetical protein AOX59_06440 [Lentibacillus amyloliquefaciens]